MISHWNYEFFKLALTQEYRFQVSDEITAPQKRARTDEETSEVLDTDNGRDHLRNRKRMRMDENENQQCMIDLSFETDEFGANDKDNAIVLLARENGNNEMINDEVALTAEENTAKKRNIWTILSE